MTRGFHTLETPDICFPRGSADIVSISDILKRSEASGLELLEIYKLSRQSKIHYIETDSIRNTLNNIEVEISQYISSALGAPIEKLRIKFPGGNGHVGMVPTLFARALLRLSAEFGVPPAMKWLDRVLSKKSVQARTIIGVHGLSLSSPVEIAGLKLLPLTDLSSSPGVQTWLARAQADPSIFSLEVVAVREYETTAWLASEVEHPEFGDLQKWRLQCDILLKAIGYADGGSPSLGEMWSEYVDPDLDVLELYSGYSWAVENAPRPMATIPLTQAGIAAGERHLALTGQLRTKLDLAASRLSIARRRIGDPDRAIDVSIAFEALLGDNRLDLTYKLGLRAARLLSSDVEIRKSIRKTIKEFYSIRSAIVHGSKDGPLGAQEIKHIGDAIGYCARLISLIAEKGKLPDWDEVELSADQIVTPVTAG